MTAQEIQRALDAMDRSAAKILKSKEASRKFLIDAGIIKDTKKTTDKKKTK